MSSGRRRARVARDPDGKVLPGITSRRARKARKKAQEGIGLFETRGRRSFSQKSRDLSGDIGSLLAPAATAGIFAVWIDKTFPAESIPAYDLAFGPEGFDPFHSKGGPGPYDVTLNFYTKILLRRFLRGLFVAVALFMMLRFIRHLGRS